MGRLEIKLMGNRPIVDTGWSMMSNVYSNMLFLLIYNVVIFWLVFGLSVILIKRRNQRMPYYYMPITKLSISPSQSIIVKAARAFTFTNEMTNTHGRHEKTRKLTEHLTTNRTPQAWQLPVQHGTPDQIVIHIEPDGRATEEMEKVRRIIDYLQTTRTA